MLLLVIAAVTLLVFWKLFVSSRKERLIDKIPGPKTYPIIGNFFDIHKPTDRKFYNALPLKKNYLPICRNFAKYPQAG